MNNRHGLNSLYNESEVPSYSMSRSDTRSDTEVPSYFLSGVGNAIIGGLSKGASALANIGAKAVGSIGNLATKAGGAIAGGASQLGNLISNVPIVGNVVGGAVNNLGSGLGQIVGGNLGSGLSSLYTGADKLVGGLLPGGIGSSQGWMANLYNAGDAALGGYLPNLGGGFGKTIPAGGGLSSMFGGGGGGGGAAGGGMSGWDKAATAANMLQAGAGIYSMLKPQGNAGAYQQSAGPQVQPVLLGAGGAGGGGGAIGAPASTGLVNASDPALSAGGGGGNVPTIAQATGGAAISDIGVKKNGEDLSKALNNLNKNKTQQVAEGGLGIDIA